MTNITKVSARFTEASLDEETVIMLVDSGEFYSLSDTGTVIWRMIDGTRDRKALLTLLAEEFGVSEGDIEAELDDFLAELRNLGLVEGA